MKNVLLGVGATLFALLVIVMVFAVQSNGVGQSSVVPSSVSPTEAVALPASSSGNYLSFCRDKWTKRGEVDDKMVDYCVSREMAGYAELRSVVQANSSVPYLNAIVQSAVAKWSSSGQRQDSMVHHTVKKEIEGFKDLEYERKQPRFDQGRAERCQAKWGFQYSMVVYCYKGKGGI